MPSRMRHWISQLWALRGRPEGGLLGAALLAVVTTYGFFELSEALGNSQLQNLDRWLLRLARTRVVEGVDSRLAVLALNLTALGSLPVLTLLVVIVVGIMLVQRQRVRALWVAGTTTGGGVLTVLLKGTFMRPRPDVVEPVVRATGSSFPSGHALSSAVVYLTLGALLASSVSGRRLKLYVLTVSMLLTGMVGVTRVLLAVHYPSDVVAGWMAGLAWALVSWLAFELIARRQMLFGQRE